MFSEILEDQLKVHFITETPIIIQVIANQNMNEKLKM